MNSYDYAAIAFKNLHQTITNSSHTKITVVVGLRFFAFAKNANHDLQSHLRQAFRAYRWLC
jgi:hypothetical protein